MGPMGAPNTLPRGGFERRGFVIFPPFLGADSRRVIARLLGLAFYRTGFRLAGEIGWPLT